jgi:hypothetical protein
MMAIWLNAWAGDNAGNVMGRQPYRALVALTITDGSWPVALVQSGDLEGTPWFFNIYATCLTPGSMSAVVTDVEFVGDYVYSLKVQPWQFGDEQKAAWEPGVHLFSIMMLGGGGSQSGAIASVVVPDEHAKIARPFKFSDFAAQQVMQRRMDR